MLSSCESASSAAARMGGFHVRNYDAARLRARWSPSPTPTRSRARRALGRRPGRRVRRLARPDRAAPTTSTRSRSPALPSTTPRSRSRRSPPACTCWSRSRSRRTLPDALRMRGAALEADRKLMVGHVERFNPAVEKLRELVADGRLGTRLPRPRDPGRAAADADPGHRRRDRPRHPRPRRHAVRPRPLDPRDLRRRRPLPARLPGGPARPACCASATERRRSACSTSTG